MNKFLTFIFAIGLTGLTGNCSAVPARSVSLESRPVENKAELEGYLDAPSYFPGDKVTMYIHTLAGKFSFFIARLGAHETPLDVVEDVAGYPQDYRTDSYAKGPHWKATYSYTLPSDLPSGLYAFKLVTEINERAGNPYYIPFVVKGRKGPGMPSIVVMSNTLTWEAYNSWGGGSFYKGSKRNPQDSLETIINLMRPSESTCHNSPEGHTGCAEKHTGAFLDQNKYAFHEISNLDLHYDPKALVGYNLLIINTHSEYWTTEMFDHLEAFLKGGGSVLNISGNVLWWKVTLRDDQVECQKFGGIHAQTGEQGGQWQHLGRPSDPLLGVRSSPKGIHTFAPLRVLDASHWLFRGTGLENGDLLGAIGLNEGGASGWETDKLGPLAPPGTVLLARGLNPQQGGADVVYFETPAGGAVLSAGSISFPGSLVLDDNLQVIVKHFLDTWR